MDKTINSIINKLSLKPSLEVILGDPELDYDIDAVLQVVSTLDYQIDVLYKKTENIPILLDTQIVFRTELMYLVDVLLEYLAPYYIDIILLGVPSSVYNLDTVILKTVVSNYNLDAKIANIYVSNYLLDVYIVLFFNIYKLDVVLSKVQRIEYQINTILSKAFSVSYSIDLLQLKSFSIGYAIDFVSYEPVPRHYIARGWEAKIFIDEHEVGLATDVEVTIEKEIEEYYPIESPLPKLIEHRREIRGIIRKAWVNTAFLRLLGISEDGFSWDSSQEFTLTLYGKKTVINPQTIILGGCRFTKGRINIPQSGVLEEELEFVAKTAKVGYYPVPGIIKCPPSGQYIINSTFDEGSFGWEYQNVYFWYDGCPYWNHYAYFYPYFEDAYLRQQHTIPGKCISSFAFDVRAWYTVTVTVTIEYSDGSQTVENIQVSGSWNWQRIDCTSLIDKNKIVSAIKISASGWNYFDVDNVELWVE